MHLIFYAIRSQKSQTGIMFLVQTKAKRQIQTRTPLTKPRPELRCSCCSLQTYKIF